MKKLSFVLVIFLIMSMLLTPSTFASSPLNGKVSKIYGLDYSPYIKADQGPAKSSLINDAQLTETMKAIAPYTQWIRTYGCTGSLAHTGSIAHKNGLKIAVGAWLSKDLKANDTEIANLIKIAKNGQADTLIVGSETLYRGDLTESQLAAYILKVKTAVPNIPVTTADTGSMFLQHPSIIKSIDVVFANIYPYWDGVEITESVRALNTQYLLLKKITKDKKIIISETGWPSSGNTIGKAIPSAKNQSLYFLNFVSWAISNHVSYFYFEAFDEAWKGSVQTPQEAFWGLWNKDMKVKVSMDVFTGKTMKNNWSISAKPIPTVLLPDLTLDKITSNNYLGSYGDASILSKTTSNFTLTLGKNSATWGSVAVDVGTSIHAKAVDLSGYKYVIIRAKGAKGGEKFRFGIDYGPTEFYYNKGLTTNWQNIVFDISKSSINLKDIKQIGFEIGSQWTGNRVGTNIYIDGITFTTSPTLKPTPSPTPVATPSPTAVPTASPTPVPTVTPSPTPVPTPSPVPLPDLSISSIKALNFCAYGDAGISDYVSNSSFAINMLSNSNTWGSIAADVGVNVLDLSGYKYAVIRIKGAIGGEKFRFGLGYGPTDYYYNQGLTTDWQDIKIDITNSSRDKKNIKQIGFEIGSQWTGNAVGTKIYIGGITFTN